MYPLTRQMITCLFISQIKSHFHETLVYLINTHLNYMASQLPLEDMGIRYHIRVAKEMRPFDEQQWPFFTTSLIISLQCSLTQMIAHPGRQLSFRHIFHIIQIQCTSFLIIVPNIPVLLDTSILIGPGLDINSNCLSWSTIWDFGTGGLATNWLHLTQCVGSLWVDAMAEELESL